jgi:error-prone DNA polymerase
MTPLSYAELQVTTNFSFLRGAAHPEELVHQARRLGLGAIGITDRNSLAGVVRAHIAAKELGVRLVVGARLDFDDAPSLLCYPASRAAYARLCRFLTIGRQRAPKGECRIRLNDFLDQGEGQIVVALGAPVSGDAALADRLGVLHDAFGDRLYLAAHHVLDGGEDHRRETLRVADRLGIPVVATNDVLYHARERRVLQDVLTCIREQCTIEDAGVRLLPNGERYLKPAAEMERLFAFRPDAVARSMEIVERCRFNLDELSYRYPQENTPGGRTPQGELEELVWSGAATRYPAIPEKVRAALARELKLINELAYASYFLTVHDIVRFARQNGIVCQGRGSAANSAVCYVLGITPVDPERSELLFERFISAPATNRPTSTSISSMSAAKK